MECCLNGVVVFVMFDNVIIICVYITCCGSFYNNGSDNNGSIGLTFVFLFRFDLEFVFPFRIINTFMHWVLVWSSGGWWQLYVELGSSCRLGLRLGLRGGGIGVKKPVQSCS